MTSAAPSRPIRPTAAAVWLAGLLLAPGGLAAASYHVSPSGDDAASGLSPAEAWATLDRVDLQDLEPGDSVLLEGGAVFEGALRLGAGDAGTPASPVSIGSYGAGRATIRCLAGSAVTIEDAGGFVLRGLVVEGPGHGAPASRHGVELVASDPAGARHEGVTIEDVEVRGFHLHGIDIRSTHASDPGFCGVSILGCEVHDNGRNGIVSGGVFAVGRDPHFPHGDILVRDCRIHDNPGEPGLSSHSGSGVILSFVNGATIEYCEAWANGWLNDAPGGGPVALWAWEANDVLIQFNEAHHNSAGGGGDGGGFDLDGGCTNSLMQYNYSHDNDGAGFGLFQFDWAHPYDANVVRYNVSQGDGQKSGAAVHLWATDWYGGIQNVAIYGNVFYVSESQNGAGIQDIEGSRISGITVANNVFVTAPGRRVIDLSDTAPYRFVGNAYHSYGGPLEIRWGAELFDDLASWRASTGQETLEGAPVGLEGEPGLAGAGFGGTVGDPRRLAELAEYRLEPGSPLRDAGVDLRALGLEPGTRDFYGGAIPRGAAFDVGAEELGCSDPPLARDDVYELPVGLAARVQAERGLLANDAACAGPLEALLVTPPAAGFLELAADGSFRYEAPPGLVGEQSFRYRGRDGLGASAEATVRLRLVEAEACWGFEEGAGLTTAAQPPGLPDGALVGMDPGAAWVPGRVGLHALAFDGIDDRVELGALNLATRELTLTAWLRRQGPQPAYAGVIFTRDGSSVAGLGFGSTDNPDWMPNDELGYTWHDETATWGFHSDLFPPDGEWAFVALSLRAERAELYLGVDGLLRRATNRAVHAEEAFDGLLNFGADGADPLRYFRGELDQVCLYRRALEPEAVLALFEAVPGAAEAPGLVPDGAAVPGLPLRLTRPAAGTLRLDWDASCRAEGTDFVVYRGSLGAFDSSSAAACTSLGATSLELGEQGGSAWFLVAAQDGAREGGTGFTSLGEARPVSPAPCRSPVAGGCD